MALCLNIPMDGEIISNAGSGFTVDVDIRKGTLGQYGYICRKKEKNFENIINSTLVQDMSTLISKKQISNSAWYGTKIPYYNNCLNYAKQAHKVMGSGAIFVGTDILLSDKGPIVCESNLATSISYNMKSLKYNNFDYFKDVLPILKRYRPLTN